jgi:hypothetical protein
MLDVPTLEFLPIEFTYRIERSDLEDLVEHGEQKRFTKILQKAHWRFVSCYIGAAFSLILFAYGALITKIPVVRLVVLLSFSVIAARAGYYFQQGWSRLKVQRLEVYGQERTFVFRARQTDFSIIEPGVSELSINWRAVRPEVTARYLILHSETTRYRIPVRFIDSESREHLNMLFQAVYL